MELNVVVDVVIGLVVLFWIVASTASFVVEAISSFLNVRGLALEKFVTHMIRGNLEAKTGWLDFLRHPSKDDRPDVPRVTGLPADLSSEHRRLEINDHPLVRRLAKPATNYDGKDTPPSYIPADLFAKALIDRMRQIYAVILSACDIALVLRQHVPGAVPAEAARWAQTLSGANARDSVLAMLAAIAGRTGAAQSIEASLAALPSSHGAAVVLRMVLMRVRELAPDAAACGQVEPASIDWSAQVEALWPEIEAVLAARTLGVADLQAIVASGRLPAPLAAAVKPLLDAANHDIEAFRRGLENWFDSVMDRASGWFRRRTQWWLGGVALVMAMLLNLDAIYIGQQLVADRETRDAAVRMGQTVVSQGDRASTMPLTYLFLQRYKDGAWADQLKTASDPLAAANALARQVQPMLLASGRFVEPMLALQSAALEIDKRCAGAGQGPECGAQDWARQSEAREALVAAMCRVAIGGPGASRADRQWLSLSSDKQLLADDRRRCAGQQALIPSEAKSTVVEVGVLWASQTLVWDDSLARAAWAVRRAAVRGENANDVVPAFREAMHQAIEAARVKVQAADELLARLPYVGSFGQAVEHWKSSQTSWWWQIPLSALGWLITAFMASLGAPMWFDLLNRLINRRITGPKPEPAASASP